MAWTCTHSLYAQQYFIKTLFTWPENVPIRFTPRKCTHSLNTQQYFIKTLFTWPENVPIRFTPSNTLLKPCLHGLKMYPFA